MRTIYFIQAIALLSPIFLSSCGPSPTVLEIHADVFVAPSFSPNVSPSPSPLPSPSPKPKVLGPCEGQAIPIGTGLLGYSVFQVNTSPGSADQIFLQKDCTWFADWSDKTWAGGGTAYDAKGTFSFKENTITFLPSGLTYAIYTLPYRPDNPFYALSLSNPEILYSLRTPDASVKTGLAFEDWTVNTYLKETTGCNFSQEVFEMCLRDRYDPIYNLNGKSSILWQ